MEEGEDREMMLARHAREVDEHRTASAGLGKKKRAEAARKEDEMRRRHGEELQELQERMEALGGGNSDSESDGAAAAAAAAAAGDGEENGKSTSRSTADGVDDQNQLQKNTQQQQQKKKEEEEEEERGAKAPAKKSRAQKRREQRAREEAEREARIEAEKANAGPSLREAELKRLQSVLLPKGLTIFEIQADGHCLFRAVEDQLRIMDANARGDRDIADHTSVSSPHAPPPSIASTSYTELRSLVASHMRRHSAQYIPFIEDELTGDNKRAAFDAYCDDMANTAKWGGQLELQALADAIPHTIEVYSADMPPVCFGPEPSDADSPIRICYQKHAFGLGEHYNSLRPL